MSLATESPSAAVLQMAMGRWVSHIVGVAAELGLADQLATGPKTAQEIALAVGLHRPSLYRLLRALASVGVFVEHEDQRFAQNAFSDTLRSDVPYSVRGVCRMMNRPWTIQAWTELEHSVRSGESAFESVNGQTLFDYLATRSAELDIVYDAMGSFTTQLATAVADAYDFGDVGLLADIGGSHGTTLATFLTRFPALRGLLFEQPSVARAALGFLESLGVSERVEITDGDFFEHVPSGADAYMLQHILHDWSDADALRILKVVHTAATVGTRLLVIEAVVDASARAHPAKLLDINMLALTQGGRERTLQEWRTLLDKADFTIARVVPTGAGATVIEAIRN
jgi:O-methyltransferase domain/Dimerisation domain